jgi:hypothetical protein
MSKTNIYYITREGRACSTEGMMAYAAELKDKYNKNIGEPIFFQGEAYNNPDTLIEKLAADEDPIIILSMPEQSAFLMNNTDAPNNIKNNVISMLKNAHAQNASKTSWEIIYADFTKALNN